MMHSSFSLKPIQSSLINACYYGYYLVFVAFLVISNPGSMGSGPNVAHAQLFYRGGANNYNLYLAAAALDPRHNNTTLLTQTQTPDQGVTKDASTISAGPNLTKRPSPTYDVEAENTDIYYPTTVSDGKILDSQDSRPVNNQLINVGTFLESRPEDLISTSNNIVPSTSPLVAFSYSNSPIPNSKTPEFSLSPIGSLNETSSDYAPTIRSPFVRNYKRRVNSQAHVSSKKMHSLVVGTYVPPNKTILFDPNLKIFYSDVPEFLNRSETVESAGKDGSSKVFVTDDPSTSSHTEKGTILSNSWRAFKRSQSSEVSVLPNATTPQFLSTSLSTSSEPVIDGEGVVPTQSLPIYKYQPETLTPENYSLINLLPLDNSPIESTNVQPLSEIITTFTTDLTTADPLHHEIKRFPRPPLFPQYIYSLPAVINNQTSPPSTLITSKVNETAIPTTNRTCNDIFDAYNCTCPPGFNGSVCENNINDCLPNPCTNSGDCVDGINNFECVCRPGFTGKKCEIKIDPCANHECQNNGVCKLRGDINYSCECDENFFGNLCQIPTKHDCEDLTNPGVCQNNGTCKPGLFEHADLNKTLNFECQCQEGFEGVLCELERNYCDEDNKCLYGVCQSNHGFHNYTCKCNPGFTGIFCDQDIDECYINNNNTLCLNSGICLNEFGNYTCQCLEGWTGQNCELDVNECTNNTNLCENNGICINKGGSYECNCSGTNYKGSHCEIDIDECEIGDASENDNLPYCTENGRCINLPGSHRCECHQGYTGERCETVDCTLIHCANNGSCQINEAENTWRCICSNNSYGLFCENLSSCLNKPCTSGICYNIPNQAYDLNYTCECDANHTGPNCSEPSGCLKQPCGEGATCLNLPNHDYNLNFTCVCPPNATGPLCKPTDNCVNNHCLNGDCVNNQHNYTCNCLPGYTGEFCSINANDCEPNPCNNSGRCVDGINTFKCICDGTGFEGDRCENDIDECLNNPCLNNGTCINVPGLYRCECPEYLGDNCEFKNPCAPNPCLNGGTCKVAITNDYNIAECVCLEPFFGDLCQNDPSVHPMKVSSPRKKPTYIIGTVSSVVLFTALVSLIAFMFNAKKKRATRGAYSPSKQEVNGPSVTLDHVLKPPPEERLI